MSPVDSILAKAAATLVVAPHPDDESLGCGGLIAMLAARGRRVHTVFVTDGGSSHLNSASWNRKRLAARRAQEAEEALRRLGAGNQPRSFLNLSDAAMPTPGSAEHEAAVAALTEIVGKLRPDLALLPWRRDPHRDHRDSWALAMAALGRARHVPEILEYAIWLDEIGAPEDRPAMGEAKRVEVDVTGVAEAKRRGVAAHESQLGGLIVDDPAAFRLTPETVRRLTGPTEVYWAPCAR